MNSTEFLAVFFGEGNDLRWVDDRLQWQDGQPIPPEFAEWIDPWIDDLREQSGPVVLPRRRGTDVDWYAIAFNDRQRRELSEHLQAFIGPTYASWEHRRALLDGQDPVEAAVASLSGDNAFVLSVPPGVGGVPFRDALGLLRVVRDERPARPQYAAVPTGRLLRDFDQALPAADFSGAEAILETLRSAGKLDSLNLSFLTVRLLVAQRRWGTLLESDLVDDLLDVRRPLLVTRDLVGAVYEHELAPFERTGSPEAAVSHFRSEVLPRFGSLFTTRAGLSGRTAVKAFMIAAAGSDPPRPRLRDTLLTLDIHEDDRAFVDAVAVLVGLSDSKFLDEALRDGDLDLAFQLAVDLRPGPERVRYLIELAVDINTMAAAQVALAALTNLRESAQVAMLAMRRMAVLVADLECLTGASSGSPVVDWVTWVSRLREDSAWDSARTVAEQGRVEWTTDLALDPEWLGALVAGIDRIDDPQAVEQFINIVPLLLAWFRVDGDALPPRALRSVLRSIQLQVQLFGGRSVSDLDTLTEIAELILGTSPDGSEYTTLVNDLLDVWVEPEVRSYMRLPWALDVLDILVSYPRPDSRIVVGFLSSVLEVTRQHRDRLVPSDFRIALLRQYGAELGSPTLFDEIVGEVATPLESPGEDVLPGDGFRIGIYTLTEGAAARARLAILDSRPASTVDVNHDHVCTPSLRALASAADLMIVVTRSAAHAATDCIRDNLSEDTEVLYPYGKGAGSILHALEAWAMAQGVTPSLFTA